ncbi:DUF7130 family rubredoxin-like protein [Natronocalculus amylovorans]|uniref:DUF7130 domain-containing protein n=1 Tax=Natronocalculus amylovorans TaxID=2917812 RepID=A0AAE3K7K5_9EURY|nr:hypothetical protein [Natronocalculus amylovorans]MCL9816103.1 hypothetical protein [Natronocalculus amylovorans]NUE01377.1 hypothetical protein [Halorubraceae archaeon YAN]
MSNATETIELELRDTVYDADGTELGVVRGFDDAGFYVAANAHVETISADRTPGSSVGEAYLMWRCWECGEMGELDTLPESCPACGARKEELYYWTED